MQDVGSSSNASKRPRETTVADQKMVRAMLLGQSGMEIPTVKEICHKETRRKHLSAYQEVWFASSAIGGKARKCSSTNKNCAANKVHLRKGILKDEPRLEVRFALVVGVNGAAIQSPCWAYEAVCCNKACLQQHPRPQHLY